MLPAVNFNDEFDGPAHEVANVRADGDLAVEPNATELAIADHGPEVRLRIRGVVTEIAGTDRWDAVVGFVQQALPNPSPRGGACRSRAERRLDQPAGLG